MSLKEATADLHEAAETTPFMKSVFAKQLPISVWEEWTYWRFCFYSLIEDICEEAGYLEDIQGIKRADGLFKDYLEMRGGDATPSSNSKHAALVSYENYLKQINPEQALAHMYVWHMGDLYGGQMIKRVIPAPSHHALEFNDASTLKENLRAKLEDTDAMKHEARAAFYHAINLLKAVYHE